MKPLLVAEMSWDTHSGSIQVRNTDSMQCDDGHFKYVLQYLQELNPLNI